MNFKQIRASRKGGSYKIYKLPVGSMFIPSTQTELRKKYGVLKVNNCNLRAFRLKEEEYIVQNTKNGEIYKCSKKDILDKFESKYGEDLNIQLRKATRHIDRLFDKLVYDKNGRDYIIDGVEARLNSRACSIMHNIKFGFNAFGKLICSVDNKEKYTIEQFKAEFDNRYLPSELKAINTSKEMFDISSLIKNTISDSIDFMSAFREYSEHKYAGSVLNYFGLPNIEICGNDIKYDKLIFRVELKGGYGYLYSDNKMLYKNGTCKFAEALVLMFGLQDIAEIGISGRIGIAAEDIQILDEYKQDSTSFNKAISKIMNGDKNVSLNDYIKSLYLYQLIGSNSVYPGTVLFRGGFKHGDRCGFKSLSLCMPVAFGFAHETDEIGFIKTNNGMSILATGLSGKTKMDEAECILNAEYTYSPSDSTGIKCLNIRKEEYIDDIINNSNNIYKLVVQLLRDNVIRNYLSLESVIENSIKFRWIYSSIDAYMTLILYKDYIKIDGNNTWMSITDTNLIRQAIRKEIDDNLERGMYYAETCSIVRNIMVSVQAILARYRVDVMFRCKDRELQIIETHYKLEIHERIGRDTKIIYSQDKTKVDYSAVIEAIAVRLLNTYGLSKVGYIQDVLEQNKWYLDLDEIYRYPDRIKIHKNNMYYDIYSQENKVFIRDEHDKNVLNITLNFGSKGRLNEINCRNMIMSAVKSL